MRTPVDLGPAGYLLPPMTTIVVVKVEAAGQWQTPAGVRVQQRLFTVKIAYEADTSEDTAAAKLAKTGFAVLHQPVDKVKKKALPLPSNPVAKLVAEANLAKSMTIDSITKAKPMKERLTDLPAFRTESPIKGMLQAPLLSLADAAAAMIVCNQHDAKIAFDKGTEIASNDPHGLTADEAGSIVLYTMDTPVYTMLNRSLREADREQLTPFLPYLKLMYNAYAKLPKFSGSVWRGVKKNLKKDYKFGAEIQWWSFSSTTKQLQTLTNPMFLGATGQRTIFLLETNCGVDIERFSAFASESEVLLFPGTKLRVAGQMNMGGDLLQVHLQEVAETIAVQ